jgi:hypothetical protein
MNDNISHTQTNIPMNTQNTSRRRGLIALMVVALLGIGLVLDLQFKGLVWQFAWSQTGEESILGQIRGLAELGGNLLRRAPQTDPYAPINHNDAPPFGINVFLQKEVEEDKIRAMLDMISEAGFYWLRQEFTWEDIEVDGRGQFTDSRNDFNGDGEPDTISSWDKYDRIVDLVEEFDLHLLVRLSNPPAWSRADNPDTLGGALAPPDDLQDFVNFASAVAERYKGRITHYQVWNEPNIYPEWGENFADPEAYTEMLCRTHDALKAIDPNIVVVSAAIAPTISLDGFAGYQDVLYLQKMYDAGAGECFDVLSAQGYGLFSGPTDRRLRTTSVNYARHTYYRDLMVANGDSHKPIWISETAWNQVADAELPPEQIADYERFGVNTQDEAARYMPIAYQRAAQEWSWVGQVTYWFFTRPDPSEQGQSFYYFRMVEPDYSAEKPTFTPLPIYNTVRDYIQGVYEEPRLWRGTYQAEHWAIELLNDSELEDDTAQFGRAMQTEQLDFKTHSTSVTLRIRAEESPVSVVCDCLLEQIIEPAEGWQTVQLHANMLAGDHKYNIHSEAPFVVDSITVYDHTWRNITPILASGAGLLIFVLGVLVGAWRRRG